nr:nitroreductase family protein [Bradyrhizobium zhanjiangense]
MAGRRQVHGSLSRTAGRCRAGALWRDGCGAKRRGRAQAGLCPQPRLLRCAHAVFIFMPEPFDTREATDIGMYAQTLMLAFIARGIASCAQGALGLFPDIVRAQLGIPGHQKLLFGISFGYEDIDVKANAARADRAPMDDVVRFHR